MANRVAALACVRPQYWPTSEGVARGLYAPQLHWWRTQFSRRQMLLLNMHTVMSSSAGAYVTTVLNFMGIPAVASEMQAELDEVNRVKPWQQDDALSCSMRHRMAAIYAPWNAVLYALEPEFDRFPPPEQIVPCLDHGNGD